MRKRAPKMFFMHKFPCYLPNNMLVVRFPRLPNSSPQSQLQDLSWPLTLPTKYLLAGFAVRARCLCPRADRTQTFWVFHPNLSLQKHSQIQDLGKRCVSRSSAAAQPLPPTSAAGQGPSTLQAAFPVINNGFSPSQAPVLRLLSPLLPYVVPGIPANPVTFSSVPRLHCMATCHMSGIPSPACSSGAGAQWEALLLPHLTEREQSCIHSVSIQYLWAGVKKTSPEFGIPSARSRAGSSGIITDLSISLPCRMTGKRSMPSICLSLGGCRPARERLVLNRSITLPSWWLTWNKKINRNTFAKSPSGKSVRKQVPSKAPRKALPLHCCSHQQTPLKITKQRKQPLFPHFHGEFAFWFFFSVFLSLSSLLCIPFPGACCRRAQLNLANSNSSVDWKISTYTKGKKSPRFVPSSRSSLESRIPWESSQKAQG